MSGSLTASSSRRRSRSLRGRRPASSALDAARRLAGTTDEAALVLVRRWAHRVGSRRPGQPALRHDGHAEACCLLRGFLVVAIVGAAATAAGGGTGTEGATASTPGPAAGMATTLDGGAGAGSAAEEAEGD